MACVPALPAYVVCSTRPGSSSSSSSTRQLAILTPLGLFCFGETHDPGTRCWCFFPRCFNHTKLAQNQPRSSWGGRRQLTYIQKVALAAAQLEDGPRGNRDN